MTSSSVLVRGGRIWCGRGLGMAEALVVRDGGVAWVGPDRDAQRFSDDVDQVVELEGRFVTPGIVDAHNHVRLGTGDHAVQLARATTMAEVRSRIDAWVAENPSATWVHAEGFDYAALGEPRHPRVSDLEGVGGGRPVMVLDYSVHAALLNEAALAAFGVGEASGTVRWGTVERDDAGRPTGYVAD